MDLYQSIIAGYDGSENSAGALREAARIARWSDADLHIVEALYDELVAKLCRDSGVSEEALLAGRRERLERESRVLLGDPLPPGTTLDVVVGHPFSELMRHCDSRDADLLVLGATGTTGAPQRPVGAVATTSVRHAPCEVMLVRGPAEHGFTKVLCGIDFSETSGLALDHAAGIARQDGAELHIAIVFAPDWKRFAEESGGQVEVPEETARRYHEELHKMLTDFVYEKLNDLDDLKVSVEAIEAISPSIGLCNFAQEISADLAVIGTLGHTVDGVRAIGSTAEHIVRDARCSVLTIKPEGDVFHHDA